MIRRSLLGVFITLASAQLAAASAWQREQGTGFLSSSGTVAQEKDVTGSVFAEYGLSDRVTLGLDVNGGMDRAGIPSGDGTAFLRFALSDPRAANKWAVHVGLGARYEPMEFFPSAELGVFWGRGLQWRDQYGWVGLDATVNWSEDPLPPIAKLDATIGMGLSERVKVMGQVFLTHTDSSLYKTLAPSLLVSFSEGQTTLQIGAEFPQEAGEPARLKLGIWRAF